MLARRFPEAKIAFSGGDAGILYKSEQRGRGGGVAAHRARRAAGSADPRGEVARHLRKRAFLKEELTRAGELGPGKRWLLITSAYHMPRAMGAFRQAGFEVEPWPVDYRTRGAPT